MIIFFKYLLDFPEDMKNGYNRRNEVGDCKSDEGGKTNTRERQQF